MIPMMKRVLAWMLTAALMLSVLPGISLGATAVSSDMPGASEWCDHTDHTGWTAWTNPNALPDGKTAGKYYLQTDVKLTVAWDCYAEIHLCLNGHSITQTGETQRVMNVCAPAELSIYDCTGKTTAKLTGGTGTSGAAANISRAAVLNLYGGYITGNGNAASGGAIYLCAANDSVKIGGMFNMYGGTITGNSCANGNVCVAGGKSGYTNTVFNMYGGTITGNSASGNGAAIQVRAYGIVNITDGIITGNTAAAGSAVSVADNAKLTVSGDTVIAGNTNSGKNADVVLADKLYVNELTGGSNITIQTTADQTDASKVIAVNGKQTASWQAGWVTYMKLDGTETDIGYITSGSGKAFAFGHYHGDQKYTAYDGGANHNLMKTATGYYYLTHDINRNPTAANHLNLDKNATQHLCLNGHRITHNNPAIRLYYLDAGDKLYIEDCTSYRDETGAFVAGTITYGGASDSTVADGSFMYVAKGGFASLENVKVTGFHSTKAPAFRVLGEATNRATLNLTDVEITNNSNDTNYAVCYANTGATVNMTGCVIKNNTAGKTVSVLNLGGDAQVTITDTVITGNSAASYGTINVSNPNVVCKLQGATRVTGNTGGNLHLQQGDGYVFNLDGLTAGAKVGITLHKDRIGKAQMHFTTVLAEGKNPKPYCFSDDDTYKVVLDEKGRLALVEKTTEPEPEPEVKHTHCLEGHDNCADHTNVEFEPWTDSTKLPETSGNYCLMTDVTVANRAGLTNVNVNLCLNGHTIKAAESYGKSRAFYLRGTAKLTITDCDANPGKITGFKASAIMCDATCTDAAVNIYNITLSGNSNTTAGGAIAMQGTGVLNLWGAKVRNNASDTHAGGIYISGKTTATITDSVITGNVSESNGGAINLQPNSSLTLAGTTKITGNSGAGLGGAIYRHADATQLKLSGNVQITGNTVAGTQSNLHLAGSSKFTVENIGKDARVGVSTATYNRAVSNTLTADCSDRFTSDNAEYKVTYKNNTLFLETVFSHKHCLEGHDKCADHANVEFEPWTDSTKLPETSGNYCLMTDVTVANRAGLTNVNVNLCLNGHTIKAAESYEKSRAFYLRGTAKLTITDCAANPGKIAGFKASAIMCDATCTDAKIDIYNVQISGNSNTISGGAIVVQGTSALNIHSGKIIGNASDISGGAIYLAGKCTVNLAGGEISGNTAATSSGAIVANGDNVRINLSATKISGNRSVYGGALVLQNSAHLEMTGGEISGNTATDNGGGVYISTNSSMAMSGGKITGNLSDNYTAAISVQNGAKLTLSGNAQITGNTAKGNYGGIYVHNLNGGVSVSGNVQISGNTAKDKPSNLCLAGTSKIVAGKLGEQGNVGISAVQFFRPVSNEVAEDVSAGYFSDNKSLVVSYQDKALFLGAPDGHTHCDCAGDNKHCKHALLKFAPWESTTSLPESGNWYLTQDVTVTYRSSPADAGLNLCLNGHTITVAENYTKGRAFYMYDAAKLTITDCNEKPGIITGSNEGAVVFDGTCVGAQFNMYNITMSGNSSTIGGGAVLVQGTAVFNMYSGTLTENTAYTILNLDADGNPKLDASGNQTYKSNLGGGAVASTEVTAEINIYGGKIVNNRANRLEYLKANGTKATVGGKGGAIYAKGNLNIYDGAEISGNFAEGAGGGILVGGNNTTTTIHGGKITGNTGGSGGGLVCQNLTHVIINGGEITGNSGTTAGGVYVSIRSQLTMNGGTIANNTSSGDAGGMYVYASTVTLNAGSIKNNTAKGNGGGISSGKGTTTVNGVKTERGPIITVNKDFAITGNYAEKSAGGVVLNGKGGELTLNGGSITGNKTKGAAGGVLTLNSSTFYLKSGKISNNNANTGGGIYVSTNTTLKMTGGSITGNSTAKANGAGIQMLRSTAYLSGGTISSNNSGAAGGGVYLSGATAYLQGTYIGNNVAKGDGGGVGTGQAKATVNGVTQKFQCKLVLSGSTIANNKGKNGGGVIVMSYTVFDITGGAIRDNESSASAGGVYVSTNATLNMTGGKITGNHAAYHGGGVYHLNSKGNYTGGIIDGNTCGNNGAALTGTGANTVINVKGYDFSGCNATNGSVVSIMSRAAINVEDCKFYENQAGTSGTVYISTHCRGNFTGCKFYNNKVGKQGGAIYGAHNSKVTITDCIFTENTAGTDGGAILCRGSFYMTNCQVTNNTASGNGGGIATDKCGIRGSKFQDGLVLTNVTVSDNTSGGQGGGLYLSSGCRTTMTDVEITGNKAALEGGAFWAVDDTTLHNVTATGNSSGGEGCAAWYDYSVFDGHSYFVGVHKISGDIIIKDNQGGDMYLGTEVAMSVGYEGLGENTNFGVTLDAGVLTNRLYGEYNYEGGNQVYTVTYGSRSLTEPENDESMTTQQDQAQQKNAKQDILLYVGIGLFVLVIIGVAVLLIAKKKKATPEATKN